MRPARLFQSSRRYNLNTSTMDGDAGRRRPERGSPLGRGIQRIGAGQRRQAGGRLGEFRSLVAVEISTVLERAAMPLEGDHIAGAIEILEQTGEPGGPRPNNLPNAVNAGGGAPRNRKRAIDIEGDHSRKCQSRAELDPMNKRAPELAYSTRWHSL